MYHSPHHNKPLRSKPKRHRKNGNGKPLTTESEGKTYQKKVNRNAHCTKGNEEKKRPQTKHQKKKQQEKRKKRTECAYTDRSEPGTAGAWDARRARPYPQRPRLTGSGATHSTVSTRATGDGQPPAGKSRIPAVHNVLRARAADSGWPAVVFPEHPQRRTEPPGG